MFDDYDPVPALTCPVDGNVMDGWQGKEGPCWLNRYRQGEAIDAASFPVHGRFEIHNNCLTADPDGGVHTSKGRYRYDHSIDGYGVIEGGVWTETHLVQVSRWDTETRKNVVLWAREEEAA